jgi:hypothetical protein
MFYDQNQSRIIMSYPALLAAYPDSGALDNEPDRNALGLYLVREQQPDYDQRTHTLALDGVELVDGIYHARYTLVALTPDQLRALVPAKVTRRQARQALLLAGLLDQVQPAINAIPDPQLRGMAQIEWDDSQEFERNRPLLIQLGAALGLDSAALDQLFIVAHAL